jgi:hypothetical protein
MMPRISMEPAVGAIKTLAGKVKISVTGQNVFLTQQTSHMDGDSQQCFQGFS